MGVADGDGGFQGGGGPGAGGLAAVPVAGCGSCVGGLGGDEGEEGEDRGCEEGSFGGHFWGGQGRMRWMIRGLYVQEGKTGSKIMNGRLS